MSDKDFRMVPKPDMASDSLIEKMSSIFGNDLKVEEAMAKAMDRVQEAMRPALNPETLANGRSNEIDLRGRAFDLDYDYHCAAPFDERWTVIDLNTYDGAPDSEAPSTFIGRGKNKVDALRDLVEQFDDYDERPRRKFRTVGLGHPEQPAETVPDDEVTFDDGLTDDDAR